MRARVYDIDALSSTQIAAWNELLSLLPSRTAFLSHAFCLAIHDVRGNVRVVEIHGDRGEIGFLPFQVRRGRSLLGHGEQVGGHMSDHFGMVGNISAAIDPEWLLESAKLSALRFDRGTRELMPFSFQDEEKVDGVSVQVDDFNLYMKSLETADKEFVKSVARSARRLNREIGTISFTLNAANPLAELETLMAAKSEQYRRTGAQDAFATPWRRQILARLSREPANSLCRPFLSSISCDGTWIASNLGFICAERLSICYPAYNIAYRKYGPGHILFFHMIEHGVAQGIREFDFGPGEATYKLKYGGRIYARWKGALRRKSLRGYSEQALESCSWRINRLARIGRRARIAFTGKSREYFSHLRPLRPQGSA